MVKTVVMVDKDPVLPKQASRDVDADKARNLTETLLGSSRVTCTPGLPKMCIRPFAVPMQVAK